jgi:hypothetical protein
MSSIFPTTTLNLLGGDNLTFTGSMLPKVLSTSSVSIKFSDTQQTNCIPQISKTDQLVCLTEKFNSTESTDTSMSLDIVINNKTVNQALTTNSRDSI